MSIRLNAPPGYGPVVPFDKTKHAALGLRPDSDFRWCAQLNAVMVSVAEFGRALLDYPLAFVRDAKGDDLVPVAVLGLKERQNLFVDSEGRWRANTYLPMFVRRHPFCIAEVPPQGDQPARQLVCVQEDQLVSGGKPLLDAGGQPTADWEPLLKLLETAEGARQQTLAFTRRLEALGLFTAFDAVAVPHQGETLRLGGLQRIDEAKLGKLPGKKLKSLLERGELRAIHAHLLSLENFAKLLDYAHGR